MSCLPFPVMGGLWLFHIVSTTLSSFPQHSPFFSIFGAARGPSSFSSPSLHGKGQGKGSHVAGSVQGRNAAHKVPSLGISSEAGDRGDLSPGFWEFPVLFGDSGNDAKWCKMISQFFRGRWSSENLIRKLRSRLGGILTYSDPSWLWGPWLTMRQPNRNLIFSGTSDSRSI